MNTLTKSVIKRFIKAFFGGFFAVIAVASIPAFKDVVTWGSLYQALNTLALAGTLGGLSGLFLAFEKYLNWTETPPKE